MSILLYMYCPALLLLLLLGRFSSQLQHLTITVLLSDDRRTRGGYDKHPAALMGAVLQPHRPSAPHHEDYLDRNRTA